MPRPRPILDLCIVGLLGLMYASGMPSWMPGVGTLEPITQRFTVYSQLQQASWQLFAPEPRSICVWVEARVTWSDGRVDVVRTPDWRSRSLTEKWMGGRWPKYVDALRRNEPRALHEAYARWVVRGLGPREGARAVRVDLIRHWWSVPGPEAIDEALERFGTLPPAQDDFPGVHRYATIELAR